MTPAGIEPAIFRFVAQHLNHSVNAVPKCSIRTENFHRSIDMKETGGIHENLSWKLRGSSYVIENHCLAVESSGVQPVAHQTSLCEPRKIFTRVNQSILIFKDS